MKLVKGFLADSDEIPPLLKVKSPHCRFAFVTDTYNPNVEGAFAIDSDLLLNFCSQLCSGLSAEIFFGPKEKGEKFSNPPRKEFFDRTSEDVFHDILASRNGEPFLQIFGIPWYKVGGPRPYHDSATLEIYVGADQENQILGVILEFLKDTGEPFEIIEGTPTPKKKQWPCFNFLRRFL